MKNLALLLALTLSSIAFCQTNKLEGSWSCYDKTSYVVTISFNSKTNLIDKVQSYSSYTGSSLTDDIIMQDSEALKTKSYFEKNDWRLESEFVSIDDNTMKRIISGSRTDILVYKRINK